MSDLNVNSISSADGLSAPDFPNGVSIESKSSETLSIARYENSGHTLTGGTDGNPGSGNNIIWDSSTVSQGDAWSLNTSTGVFTINRPCVVSFMWQYTLDTTGGNATTALYVNRGSGYVREYLTARDVLSSGGFYVLPQYFLASLNTGDQVVMTQNYNSGSPSVLFGDCVVELKPSVVVR